MGWKGSVKARTFVLNLHDYYADHRNRVSDPPTVDRGSLSSSLGSPQSARMSPIPSPKKKTDDRWALAYINAAYVQSILEAVDDDGTGYISIKEVNTFVEERPAGWSLPEWFAYWAVGTFPPHLRKHIIDTNEPQAGRSALRNIRVRSTVLCDLCLRCSTISSLQTDVESTNISSIPHSGALS